MGTIIFNYDVEVCDPGRAHITAGFLEAAERVHRKTGAPCAMFVCGRTLELHCDAFQRLSGDLLFDFQSHTYAHSLVKSNVQWQEGRHVGNPSAGKVQVLRGASPDQVRAEVARTKELLEGLLERENIGLACPTGGYLGLLDRPELLDMFWDMGIRYVHCYHFHPEDFLHWKTMPKDVQDIIQPFWYSKVEQLRGYALSEGEPEIASTLPEILDIPQGMTDCVWKDMHGYDANEEYLNAVRATIDIAARENLVMKYTQHDWSTMRGDPTMQYTKAIIEYIREKGMDLVTPTEYYHRALKEKRGGLNSAVETQGMA